MDALRRLLLVAVLVAALLAGPATAERTAPLIVDHTSTHLGDIPAPAINATKATLHVAYGHTSHGSQLIGGMTALQTFPNTPLPNKTYAFNNGGAGGALDLHDGFAYGDLGNPDRISWANRTRSYLLDPANRDVNVVMWSWCGQVGWASEAEITTYLLAMNELETEFKNVTFVYMTGHLDGTGVSGNLNQRNEQIRAWCRAHNRVLYDFADIESYDPDGHGYLALGATDACDYEGGNWALQWQAAHPGEWYDCTAAHTQPLNGNLKAYAAWHLFARIAGWTGSAPVAITGGAGVPTDTNGDGLCDDTNGNGRRDFADVVLYFTQMNWIEANEPVGRFDFNMNGRIDFADVVWLFDHL